MDTTTLVHPWRSYLLPPLVAERLHSFLITKKKKLGCYLDENTPVSPTIDTSIKQKKNFSGRPTAFCVYSTGNHG